MAADDLYMALVRLENESNRAAAAAGDRSFLDGLHFTDREQGLVDALLGQVSADVEGFAGGATLEAVQYTAGQVSDSVLDEYPPSDFGFGALLAPGGFGTDEPA